MSKRLKKRQNKPDPNETLMAKRVRWSIERMLTVQNAMSELSEELKKEKEKG